MPQAQRPDDLVSRALRRMQPVALDEVQDLALLRRTDVKYLLPRGDLAELLSATRTAYSVLQINGRRVQRYRTLYYDTPDLALYLLHHNGARRRFKVRCRNYVESDLTCLEVKSRERGDRTIKSRIEVPKILPALTQPALAYVARTVRDTNVTLEALRPTLWNAFSRITLVSLSHGERITLDMNVALTVGARSVYLDDWVIVEIKGEAARRDTPMVRALRARGLRPTGLSKYCMGVASLYPTVKHNRFSRKLRLINLERR